MADNKECQKCKKYKELLEEVLKVHYPNSCSSNYFRFKVGFEEETLDEKIKEALGFL